MNNPFSSYIESGELMKVAGDYARSGPEYHGACPLCGAGVEHGKESAQFVCWPEHPKKADRGGGYLCRNCTDGKLLSGVDFLMTRDNLSAAEAFKALGLTSSAPTVKRYRRMPALSSAGTSAAVGEATSRVVDADAWCAAATAFLARAGEVLKSNPHGMKYITDRGFTASSIEAFKFGFVLKTLWVEWSAWGMADPGNGKQMPLPRGWVVPIFDARGRIAVLKIRRPQEDVLAHPEWGKYFCLKRTNGIPSWTPPIWHPGRPVIVFEGEFDAALVQQEASPLVNAISTGSTSNCIDRDVLQKIGSSPVFVAMDADEAGQKKQAEYDRAYPDWETVEQPAGFKDAGEAHAGGVDLREWVRAFLPSTMLRAIEAQLPSSSAGVSSSPSPSPATPSPSPEKVPCSDSSEAVLSDAATDKYTVESGDTGLSDLIVSDAPAAASDEAVRAHEGEADAPKPIDGIRPELWWLLSAEDVEWLDHRLRNPSAFTDEEYTGIRLARHYLEGGELVPYRQPFTVLDTDGIPTRCAQNNLAMRAALARCKYPSKTVCVRTDAQGREFWDVTARGAALLEHFMYGDW